MKLTQEAVMSGKVSMTNIKASDIEEFGASVGFEYAYDQSKQSNLDALRVHLSGLEPVDPRPVEEEPDTVTESTTPIAPEPTPAPEAASNWATRRAAKIAAEMRGNPTPAGNLRLEDLPDDAPAFLKRRAR